MRHRQTGQRQNPESFRRLLKGNQQWKKVCAVALGHFAQIPERIILCPESQHEDASVHASEREEGDEEHDDDLLSGVHDTENQSEDIP